MDGGKYEGLLRFIHYTEKELHVKICLKDYVGFISIDRELSAAMIDNLAHGNPFCMYMKSDEDSYIRCTSMAEGVMRRLKQNPQAYCGVCHAGVKEYISPIWYEGQLVGSVHAGVFGIDLARAKQFIQRACRKGKLDSQRAFELYHQQMNRMDVDEERLMVHLEMITTVFIQIFARLSMHADYSLSRPSTVLSHNGIVSDALEYLKQNYLENLTVVQTAAYCHCSVSCLSHLFKTRTGLSIPLYLAKLRVDHAKEELVRSHEPVSTVAEHAGFSDPNYFSRLFARYVGLTPTQYRKRFTKGAGDGKRLLGKHDAPSK